MTQLLAAPPGATASPARRRRPGIVAGTGLTLLLSFTLVALAACGSSGGGNGVVSLADPSAAPAASPSASVDPEEAMLAFSKCMREHGVDIHVGTTAAGGSSGGSTVEIGGSSDLGGAADAPQTGTKAFDPKTVEAADEACKGLLPAGGMGDPNASMDPAVLDAMLAFAQCMRDNGVDFPDPQSNGVGIQAIPIGGSGGIDPASKTFQAAEKACSSKLPVGGGSLSGGGVTVAPAPAVRP